ncbi:hypothetical protein BJ508DRAFT_301505 [Ascobolus immersus RN42]|uniref:Uncharacterized protein n=1 Tax=Ascobolus immersus RN42 TaxID=1160509 RepID=A0A3N4ILW6_ASCIM|nr:hypothetical protein BJ508DRAFT_301505 [Ascobolus immersus RN42]
MPLQTYTIPALPAAPSHRLTLTPQKRLSTAPTSTPTKPTKPSRTIPLSHVQTIKQLYMSGQHKSVISAVSSLKLETYLLPTKPTRRPLTKQQRLTIASLFFLVGESRRELAFRQRRYINDRRSQRPGSSSSAESEDRVSGGFAVTETQRQAREHLEKAKTAFESAALMIQNAERVEEDGDMDWVEKVKWERVEKAAEEFVGCVNEKLRDVEEELSLGGRKGWRQRRQSGEIQG